MSNFKKLSAYTDVPCEWVSIAAPRNDRLDQLEAENAQLRELVKDMACEYECGYLTLPQWLVDRMHELGVGVD